MQPILDVRNLNKTYAGGFEALKDVSLEIERGEIFGPDTPVIIQCLEITPAMKVLEGVAMEMDDCAFPLLEGMVLSDDPKVAFKDTELGLVRLRAFGVFNLRVLQPILFVNSMVGTQGIFTTEAIEESLDELRQLVAAAQIHRDDTESTPKCLEHENSVGDAR